MRIVILEINVNGRLNNYICKNMLVANLMLKNKM